MVVAFFPAAFTGVCTKELCTFRYSMAGPNDLNATVLGISVDAPFSNAAFAEKNALTFPVLSDYARTATVAYGIALENFAGMPGYTASKRAVYVVGVDGTIRYEWVDPGVEPDYDAIKAALASLVRPLLPQCSIPDSCGAGGEMDDRRAPDPNQWAGQLLRGIDGLDQLERIRRGAWVHATSPRPAVGLTPHEVIHTHDKLAIRWYAARSPGPGVPVVVVPSLINKAYICDLEPGRSLVDGPCRARPRRVPRRWAPPTRPTRTRRGLRPAHAAAPQHPPDSARHAKADGVHLFGYCMGRAA